MRARPRCSAIVGVCVAVPVAGWRSCWGCIASSVMSDEMPHHLSAIETPAIVIDLDRMDRNLARVAEYAAAHGLALRPHVKTHKSPFVAEAQLRLGARGLTCATPREAE